MRFLTCAARPSTLRAPANSKSTAHCSHRAGALPPEVAARYPDVALTVDEVRIVQDARQHRSVVYLMGRTHARLTGGGLAHLPRRYLLEMPFKVLPETPPPQTQTRIYTYGPHARAPDRRRPGAPAAALPAGDALQGPA